MRSYKNKLIFIVGGSSGIGFALAKELTNLGANVCIFARNLTKLADAKTKILAQNKAAQIDYSSLDVLDEASINKALSAKTAQMGIPHIMINSAGFARPNYFTKISAQEFQATVNMNLIGARNIAFAILPYFKQNKGGHLVNVSSVAGFLGVFGYTDYCASKFALVGFSEALRQEVAHLGIKVSLLYPPDTDTEGFAEEATTKPPETQAVSAANSLISPEFLAKKTLKALLKQKMHILPNLDTKLSYYAKRYAPWLVDFIIMRAIKKAQKSKN